MEHGSRKPLIFTWIIVFLIGIVVAISHTAFFRPSLESISSKTVSLHLEIANDVRTRISEFMEANTADLHSLSQLTLATGEGGDKKALLEQFLKEKSWFTEAMIIDADGHETVSASQTTVVGYNDLKDFSASDVFTTPKRGEVYVSEVYTSVAAVPLVTISVPIRNSGGEFYGAVAGSISFRKIWDIVSQVKFGTAGQAYLVDKEGNLIAHPDASLVLRKTNLLSRPVVSRVLAEKIPISGNGDENKYTDESGDLFYAVAVPMEKEGWAVLVAEPSKDAWSAYRRVQLAGLVYMASLGILLILLILNARTLVLVFNDLEKSKESLSNEIEKESRELAELDRASKMLIRRDLELSEANAVLDEKLKELEESRKSLVDAFREIKEARRKSLKEKNRTMAIIANLIDPIIVLDNDNRISLLNPAAKKMLGLEIADIGKKIKSSNNYALENFGEVIRRAFEISKINGAASKNFPLEEITVKEGEEEFTYKVATAEVQENNERLGIMKIFYDITREKMIDDMKSEFISVVAHQLRTPLSAIKWSLKMILDGDVGRVNAEQKEFLQKGYASNERMINLVNDLLNISRIEEGKFGYKFEIASIETALDDALKSVRELIKARSIKLIIDKPKALPQLLIDPQKMTLVLENLLANAVKYTPEYGKIEAKLSKGDADIVVTIKDNGVGIPKSEMPKLFSKFFRASNVIRMETEGSGLGLFMVKNIIEKHGGSIEIVSEEGKGTVVTVSLPLQRVEA